HLPYLNCPSFAVRYATAIEIMVPCLSTALLAKVLPLFAGSRSGFGLDAIWTRQMGSNRFRAGILDTVTVRHTRPVGGALAQAMAAAGLSR
ncbi:hypothetical protein J8J27_27890, partial [Mycobacterium tuberculosis]|nr:hypothetical protein [Mycobacterium tuberculosis]